MSSYTKNQSARILSGFFLWLINAGLITTNPMVRIPRISRTPLSSYTMSPRTADKLCSISQCPHSRISALTWRTIPLFMRYVACTVSNAGNVTASDFHELDGCPVFQLARASTAPWIAMCREYFPLHRAIQPVIRELCHERPQGPLFPDLGTANITSYLHEGHYRWVSHGCILRQEYLPLARKISPKFTLRSWQDYLFSFIYAAYAADDPLPRTRSIRYRDPLPFPTLRTIVESMP